MDPFRAKRGCDRAPSRARTADALGTARNWAGRNGLTEGGACRGRDASNLAVTREREGVVVDVEDRPGVLADLTRRIARAGVDLDLVYVAT